MAVFDSWMNKRAITYRKLNNIPASWGTAVNVQAMVFGNMGNHSATGVAFTRDSATGENSLMANILLMLRVKTWWQVSERHSKSHLKVQKGGLNCRVLVSRCAPPLFLRLKS